jgi:hypothetical protein
MPLAQAKINSTTNGLTRINLASGAVVENLKKLAKIDVERHEFENAPLKVG